MSADQDRKALIHQVVDALYGGRYVTVGRMTYRYMARDFQCLETRKVGTPKPEVRWENCGLGRVVDDIASSEDPVVVIEPEFPLKLAQAVEALSHYKRVEARVMRFGKPYYLIIDPRKPLKVIDQESGEPFLFEGCMTEWRVIE